MNKRMGMVISTFFLLVSIVLIGPMDYFTHGFFCDVLEWGAIAEEDFYDSICLDESVYEMKFTPEDRHFAGFGLYLVNQPEGNSGTLLMSIMDEKDKLVEEVSVDLSKVKEKTLYRVYTGEKLKRGKLYKLRFSAKDCKAFPALPTVDEDYLENESIDGNVLIRYAYEQSTFTFQNKVLIILIIISLYGFIIMKCITVKKIIIRMGMGASLLLITALLAWDYMYNSLDNQNKEFSLFQADSETLVTGMIYAEEDGIWFRGERPYGLGRYHNVKGVLYNYSTTFITDENWKEGYSRTQPMLVINSNSYTKEVAKVGNYVEFENGDVYSIINIQDDGKNINVMLDADHILFRAKYGDLENISFYDAKFQKLDPSLLTAYRSQYGLQGKLFRRIVRIMPEDQKIENLHLICSIATAFVFSLMVLLIAIKFNKIMAGCFLAVFALSPWVVNFARNLYWVEFTWFLPMLVGLFCSLKIEDKKSRCASYAAAFITIAGKSLCGYEYISSVMLGLIAFLLVDFISAVINKNRKNSLLLCRTIMITGIMALFGFASALSIHAILRGNGNVIEGWRSIIENDLFRRTAGGDLNEFSALVQDSLNASVWEVCCKYFKFSTQIITGITGNLFPVLCIVPICIFVYEYKKKVLNEKLLIMYIVFFLTAISWFCLGKAHSYIHLGMNYVLWYFGFVQICFYIIVNKIIECFQFSGYKENLKR